MLIPVRRRLEKYLPDVEALFAQQLNEGQRNKPLVTIGCCGTARHVMRGLVITDSSRT